MATPKHAGEKPTSGVLHMPVPHTRFSQVFTMGSDGL